MRMFWFLTALIAALIVSISVYGYDKAKVDSYIREAEYYTKQAESFEREAVYYMKQAQRHMKGAEYYSKEGKDSKAKTYMRWAKEASDKASIRMKAKESRQKAQLRMKWAKDEMRKK